ncbi:hypothetical protein [Paracoccus saliphilus]|uniref:Uncharacterized protein n=1 Tax=Paracoccus saliphilus TaxID=405559 RepID=A0AA45W3W7_9RHOB|nr:hypothetical protein [Paracoccus saliphilus]WCR04264.1 hypothetical protein JHX88_05885 [Paracoccus saliphilus]SIS80322.1 hypothetical protein SAMN05421772_105110 [Paracoccus saliphilus]
MQMVFHIGVHGTDDDRLLKTLLNNREWLLKNGTEIVPPSRHSGLFEQALMPLKGGPATVEMEEVILDALLTTDDPERVIFSTPTFMGAVGRIVGREGLYPQIGNRVAALANLFPKYDSEFFMAIRNPATLLSDMLPKFKTGDYNVLMQGRHPLDLRWREAAQRMVQAAQGRRVVIWCHEDVPLVWPEVVRLVGDIAPDAPLKGGMLYMDELLDSAGTEKLRDAMSSRDQLSIADRRALCTQMLQGHSATEALDQDIKLPGWTQELVDEVTDNYYRDVAEIAALPGVEFILP